MLCIFLFACLPAAAEVNRVVIIKVDGLPEGLVQRYAAETATGGREGHSRLPWIQEVFGKNGTWLENFYVRGLSLSAPSWSLLDTGRHLEIRGNAEWDRYTLRVEDYLNFFPFYLGYAANRRSDMPGVGLLDEYKVPLLIDRFPAPERYQSFQLLQRGVRWKTLQSSLKTKLTSRPLKDLFDEWQTGFSMSSSINEQTERELLKHLKNPHIRYLDYFTGEFDHVAHLAEDRMVQRHVIESIDALVGRIWDGIAASPLADTTALVLVSDHGMNTADGVYSQGYSLIDWFNSSAGGAHHVMTNRHPMTEFKLRGLDPLVSEVITASPDATYLAGESAHYPTAVMDLDGNERASISLRNSSLNEVQILLDQVMHKKLPGGVRTAAIAALFEILNRERQPWQRNLEDLKEDRAYATYIATIHRLLALDPADFDPGRFNTEELIPRKSLGEPNSIFDLRHYAVGLGANGLVVGVDGSLDLEKSFRYVDYLPALSAISVRNNVQKGVAPRPVDFIAVPLQQSIWLWRSEERQALILMRHDAEGQLELRYLPIAHLVQDASGELHYEEVPWSGGFPLDLFEDAPGKEQWLSEWHNEHDWLLAVHRTNYSNGIIGLVEELLSDPVPSRYLERKRQLRRPDMLVFANDHWNFNVRGFNPGGNHGSLLRVSTHSVLMVAGGKDTGIPRGLKVETPYDSLSFVPTILTLMGQPESDLPGPVITELIPK